MILALGASMPTALFSWGTPALAIWIGTALTLSACQVNEATTQKADRPGFGADVILTAPYCDSCSEADKTELKARSEIVTRTVDLIEDPNTTLIEAAQFTFSVKEIADALKAAHERGVTVRLAIDSRQDNPDSVATKLKQAGLDVVFVKGKVLENGRTGIQHAKFILINRERLLTGSGNWSSTATTINEENAMFLSDPEIVAAFGCHFDTMIAGQIDQAGACSTDNVAFSPSSRGKNMIRDAVRQAQRSIDVLMHHLVFADLQNELIRAVERGVRVRVVGNVADRDEYSTAKWQRFVYAGGKIRFKQNNANLYQLMHHKLAIIDGKTLINGSGNWSGSAFFNNYENFVRYENTQIVNRFVALFSRLWTWSLSATSLDQGLSAAKQHQAENKIYFGSLHAHFHATDGDTLLDDGKPKRKNDEGSEVDVQVGSTLEEAAAHAFTYAKQNGGLDFLALTPHTTDSIPDDNHAHANMSATGYQTLRAVAERQSNNDFVAIAGMEWNTNSLGNHVTILDTPEIAKVERGEFRKLYESFLPEQSQRMNGNAMMMFNHPRTFAHHQTPELKGNWDQIYGHSLLDIANASDRGRKFNDYGLDEYPPLDSVLSNWISGQGMPERATVNQALAGVQNASAPYARLMEVLVARGTEFGDETMRNPSINIDENGQTSRYTRIHTDYDYYLLQGFRIAPAASHDNHYANWGTGHSSRTAIIAPALDKRSLLRGIDARAVYASEDQNLSLSLYAEDRVPMGGSLQTISGAITASISLNDPDYDGEYEIKIYRGKIGQSETEVIDTLTSSGQENTFSVTLPGAGEYFFYAEVLESGVNRAAWTAPIWVERL